MGFTGQKLGDSGRTGISALSEAEIHFLDPMVPVRRSTIELVGFDPLVDRGLVVHPGQLSGPDPGDGMLHHLVIEVVIEEVDLVVMHQDTAVVEAILVADAHFYPLGALIDVEVLAVAEFSTAEQVIEKDTQLIRLVEDIGECVEVEEIGLQVRLDRNRKFQIAIHLSTFGLLNIVKNHQTKQKV